RWSAQGAQVDHGPLVPEERMLDPIPGGNPGGTDNLGRSVDIAGSIRTGEAAERAQVVREVGAGQPTILEGFDVQTCFGARSHDYSPREIGVVCAIRRGHRGRRADRAPGRCRAGEGLAWR